MLFCVDDDKEIKDVWYKKDYNVWISKIDKYDKNAIEKIKDVINAKLSQNEIQVSSWIPGSDWTGTPLQVIYEALDKNFEIAGKCIGLIIMECIIEDDDKWYFVKGDYRDGNGMPIDSMIYFKGSK